ncbi:MAG: PAS domain S-box protein [Anaerolineaceae bacterium]|nr:PAS domain S-box protein [Anaerolineaceae bacterium]
MDAGQKFYEIQSQLKLIPGDHLCCFYKTEQEQNSLLYNFLRLGLENGQKVLYISNGMTNEQVFQYLAETGLDPEPYAAKGQLIICAFTEFYYSNGRFDPDLALANIQAEIVHAADEGFSVLRFASDLTAALNPPSKSLSGMDRLVEYEMHLDLLTQQGHFLAMCEYDRSAFKPDVLHNLLASHSIAAIGPKICNNLYYHQTENLPEEKPKIDTFQEKLDLLVCYQQVEEDLIISQLKLGAVIDQSPDGILLCNENAQIIEWNTIMEEICGIKKADVIGLPLGSILFQISPDEHKASVNSEMVKQIMQAAFMNGSLPPEDLTQERIVQRPDGSRSTIEVRFSFFKTEKGFMGLGISRDITSRRLFEEALRLSEHNYRQLAESLNEGIWRFDRAGKTSFVNPRLAEMLGYSIDEIAGRHVVEFVDEQDTRQIKIIMARLKRGIKEQHDISFLRKDGSRLYTSLETSPLYDEKGNYNGGIAGVQDISERKRVENLLRTSEERLRYIIKHNPSPIAVLDKDLRFIMVSDRYLSDYSLEDRSVIGRYLDDVFPDLPKHLRQAYQRGLAGESERVEEDAILGKDGRTEYIRWECRPWYDPNGETSGIILYTEVITERKKAEQTLHENEALLASLFKVIPAGICLTDEEGCFLQVNDAYCQMFNYSREELLGKNLSLLMTPEEAHLAPYTYTRVLTGDIRNPNEQIRLRKDGQPILILAANALLVREDGSRQVITVVSDITERKLAEQSLTQRARELEALYQTSLEINSLPDIPALLNAIVLRSSELLSSRIGGLYLMQPDGKTLQLSVLHGLDPKFIGETIQVGEGVAGKAAQNSTPIWVEDYQVWENSLEIYKGSPLRSVIGVPLKVANRIMGVIMIGDDKARSFSNDEIRLVTLFAEQAAVAVENANLYESQTRQAKEMASLYQASSQLINPASNLEALTHKIADTVTQEFINAHCAVMLIDEENTTLRIFAQSGYAPMETDPFPVDGPGLTTACARSGEIIYAPDVSKDERYVEGAAGTKSEFCIPLRAGGHILGVLNLESTKLAGFDERDHRILTSYADRAAMAIENTRLHLAEQQRARELEALHTATTTLVSTLDIQVLIERILLAAASAIPASTRGLLFMTEPGNTNLQARASYGFSDSRIRTFSLPLDRSYAGLVIKEQRALLIPDLDSEAPLHYQGDIEELRSLRAGIIAPLLMEEQALGAIALYSLKPDTFSESDLRLLISFASTVTAAIHNAELHAEVQGLAVTDPLTNLYNRRGFFELAQKEIDRIHLTPSLLSVIMFDVDLLKKANDQYGHSAGDQLLRTAAEQCRVNLRKSDIVCRYGGDEFVILLPDTDSSTAAEIAERLRSSIASSTILIEQGTIQMSVTLGVSSCDSTCDKLDTLLNRADEALYLAKRLGKNCVRIWQGG